MLLRERFGMAGTHSKGHCPRKFGMAGTHSKGYCPGKFGMAGFSVAAWSLLPSCARAPAGTGEACPGWEGGLGTGGQRDGKGIAELKSFPRFQCKTCGDVPRTQVTAPCTDVSIHDLIPQDEVPQTWSLFQVSFQPLAGTCRAGSVPAKP